jgi:hypothetical protein
VTAQTGVGPLGGALAELRDAVAAVGYPLALPDAADTARAARAIVSQLDDYLIPRLGRLDAPLLVVIGGSTGAGKSTLANSLVRAPVSPAGVRRPTTRTPVLIADPDDAPWFTEANLLPHLGRSTSQAAGAGVLRIVTASTLGPGLALLDAPDIDSVVEANRALAEQLLAAADLWLFVTTAARYADAVPWELLLAARARGAALALVLDRVPAGAAGEIRPHLAQMLGARGFADVPVYVVEETTVDSRGLLPEASVGRLRDWLTSLGRSAAARAAVVRQTLDGAIAALGPSVDRLAAASDDQVAAAGALAGAVRDAYAAGHAGVERGVRDGTLLRGEVLARWQELVGTGEFMRTIQTRVAWLRDRISAALTGRPAPADQLKEALESGLVTLVRAAAEDAAEEVARAWRAHPAGLALLDPGPASPGLRSEATGATREGSAERAPGPARAERAPISTDPGLTGASHDLGERAERMVRDWQRAVLELVREEAGNKRFVARAGAYAVNALGLVVMIAVFTATSFIPTGAEIVVAGGTTLAAQKVLEAIFGDQAVRALADRARQDLLARVRTLLDDEAARYLGRLADTGVDAVAADRLRRAAAAVRSARAAAPLPAAPPPAAPVVDEATTP